MNSNATSPRPAIENFAQCELSFDPTDTSEWQIQHASEKSFRYLPDPNDEKKLFVDFDGTGKILLTIGKQSQDRYQTRLPPDEKDPDGELIRAQGWSNFSDLFVAQREEWLARAQLKKDEDAEERAAAARKKSQAKHHQAVDQVVAAAKFVAEQSEKTSKSKGFLIDPALVAALQDFYRARGEQHWHSLELDAAILARICFLLEKPKNGKTLPDRHRYIYNTAKEWQRDHFPTKSIWTIWRALKRLEKHRLLIAEQPEGRRNRRKWYRPGPEVSILLTSAAKAANCRVPGEQTANFSSEQPADFPSDSTSQSDQYGKKSAFSKADFFPPWPTNKAQPATSTCYRDALANSVPPDPPLSPDDPFLKDLEARKANRQQIEWRNSRQPATKA